MSKFLSSLSEEQLNGNNYNYVIGIKHLIGDPIFSQNFRKGNAFN